MGFLLDRMALTAAAHPGILGAAARGEPSPLPREMGLGEAGDQGWGASSGSAGAVELDVDFLMVAFSAAVNTTPTERIRQVCAPARGCVGLPFVVACVFGLGWPPGERVDRPPATRFTTLLCVLDCFVGQLQCQKLHIVT